ncbi:ribulose bisphosphate carboxylase small subunit, chloroplastic 5-like isoform X2 [Magnolia sinica]|uniref:ribulose bisphosphate carboxylase small subunit, chloroplastic 5-like isoform X2 n=1 Tax=Magnolia sinica TaxID=86752 RepID=UPI002657CC42|nr:ribulose bisphosphate carboxylase small subunit, chloroplastic 5-like isoform X2 [Magnolia sinica]
MASSMMVSSAASTAINRAAPAQASMVAPFTGLKSAAAFPVTRKLSNDLSLPSNGGRVQCMLVWPPVGLKKFETLSYLPTLGPEALAKQIDYLIVQGWIPCVEFDSNGFVFRENNRSPGYYDGRYWTMWKLPMYGCTDASQVLNEVEECTKGYPQAFVRVIGFDNKRQMQCNSFIAYKPPGN